MRTLGFLLIAVGVLSAVLYFLHMNFMFLNWINNWGTDKAWMIRAGMVVIGFIFYFLGKRSDKV